MTVAYLNSALANAEPVNFWPDPLPLPSKLPEVPPFHAAMLPAHLRAWAADVAERMQVPLDFVAIPAMIAAGSLIGRCMGIRPEAKTEWVEVGNLWGCIVAPPGAMKSPAISEVLGPLRRLEARAAAENEQAAARYRKEVALYKLHQDAARERARKELKEGGVAEVAAAMLHDAEEPEEPIEKRYMATDATVEKLGEICADNPTGIMVHRDELLTLFKDLDRNEKESIRGFLLSAWSGRDGYTFDRIGRGTIRVPSINISLLGTTQPHRISSYLRDSLRNHDDGMVQRLQLLCWPDVQKAWKSNDRFPDVAAKAAAFRCYEQLAELRPESVGAERDPYDGGEGVPFLRFAPDALEVFGAWRHELEARVRGEDISPYFAAHLAKYRGLIPRLALIYHLANGCSGPVSLEACLAALAWSEYLEAHAARAYSSMSLVNTDVAAAILRRIKKGDLSDGFTERDVYRPQWSGLKDREAISSALKLLADHDWLRAERVDTGGRPLNLWHANPAALQ